MKVCCPGVMTLKSGVESGIETTEKLWGGGSWAFLYTFVQGNGGLLNTF